MRKPEEYEAEIEALKAEIERLRGGAGAALMTVAGAQPVSGVGGSFTIQGLEELILVIDEKGEIAYLNDRMATLLGVPADKRREVLGTPVSAWDAGPLGDVLSTLQAAVRESGQNYVIEREFPELGADRLPSLAERSVKDSPLLRFVCTVVKDKVQVVAQDVTHSNWLTKNFSRYVSPGVIEQMQAVSEDQLLRTEKRMATMLFADLRGFTRACQELEPDQVVEMINSFLSNAVEAVEKFDGMVDKFVGDEIMAVFGAPLAFPDHALRGLLAANDIIKSHEEWMADRARNNLTAPGVGIGLASGEVVVGNIGTSSRVDYTVLGHNVNLAARLCSQAGPGEILTVKDTHHLAKQSVSTYQGPEPVPRFHFDPRGVIELKNILKPVEVISVST
jgi:class 3 adenylate cyclase